MIINFVNGLEARIEILSAALNQENFSILEKEAHRLSGTTGLFGYPLMAEISAQLEFSSNHAQHEDCKNLILKLTNNYSK